MTLTIIVVLAAIFLIWLVNETRNHRPRSVAEIARRRQHVEGLYEAGRISQAEMRQMIMLGTTMQPIRYSAGDGGVVPPRDANYGYVQEPTASTAAFWEQMEEQRRVDAYRRRQDEEDQQWRDEENRWRDEARQREDEYWDRQRDNY